eukprot:m.26439 g.26439  ORF g.26439 m.26439 type:complete len:80 (-) comp8830_c0_seq1:116-355(-)
MSCVTFMAATSPGVQCTSSTHVTENQASHAMLKHAREKYAFERNQANSHNANFQNYSTVCVLNSVSCLSFERHAHVMKA